MLRHWAASSAAGVPASDAKAFDVIVVLCYALLLLAWIVDLVTPQLFISAVLLNGPIALSTLALRRSVTMRLTVVAELANILAGYVNGVAAGHHWDPIAVGDRILSGASFVLVAALTLRAQENARRAGEATERERQIASERALRHALENVRASLNMELVLRSAVREALKLTDADTAAIVTRASQLQVPQRYELRAGDADVSIVRAPLAGPLASLVERVHDSERMISIGPDDALGRLLGAWALLAHIETERDEAALILTWERDAPTDEQRLTVRAFVDNLAVAVNQARLFVALAERNEQIAEQKNRLQERNDVIRDIVYALAHDLRTPLAAAEITMTQALSGAYGALPERYREILHVSLASNADIRRLVETLLLVARYESGEDSRLRVLCSVHDLVDRVVRELHPVAEAKAVLLEYRTVERKLMLLVDGDEFRRAIANLVANAIDATPSNGRIELTIEECGNDVWIGVDDDGYGVPEERRRALFERFGGVRSGGGTGLGLYIVRRIAEKYGGHVGYEPREPRGSRFFLTLPIAKESEWAN